MNGRFLAVLVEPAGSPLSNHSAAPLSSAGLHNPLGRLVAAAYAPILIIILYYTERSIDFLKEARTEAKRRGKMWRP